MKIQSKKLKTLAETYLKAQEVSLSERIFFSEKLEIKVSI